VKTFLVGGAVRDELLGVPFDERDWVVVGSTPEQMLAAGFQQVGKDFPVFLHPISKEEYALARTERKKGVGYTGFEVHADADVTLEQDLSRRDLTINAIAKSESGDVFDPYQGREDIERRVLRHVSPAFVEDPLRVLRVARFAARYARLGFTVAKPTMQLMSQIVAADELQTLSAERVWRETEKALATESPEVFFQVLQGCGALNVLFPELQALFGVPQSAVSHPEIDCGVHSLMVLQQASLLSKDTAVRYAALVHDLGKAVTAADHLPHHPGHEKATLPLLLALQQRIKVPNRHAQLAQVVARWHTTLHGLKGQDSENILSMLTELGVFRQGGWLEEFVLCCEADSRGRSGFENQAYPQAGQLKDLAARCCRVTAAALIADGVEGKAVGEALRHQRLAVIDSFLAALK